MSILAVRDFARLFGIPLNRMPAECVELISSRDFSYTPLTGKALDDVDLRVVERLESPLPVSGPRRLKAWEDGWSENLRAFVASGYDLSSLRPGYFRIERAVMRLDGQYILPTSPSFEVDFLAVLTSWIGDDFFAGVEHVYEFGCGPGFNLLALAAVHPERYYHGLDWAKSSQRIVELVAANHELNIDGQRFDMFAPDNSYRIQPNSATMTMGGLEQLGSDFEAFLDYLLGQPIDICVHLEPIYELYDPNREFDHVAARYAEKRGYLRGYLTRLRELEAAGALEIVHLKKVIGSLFQDSWTVLAWKPRPVADAQGVS